MEIVGYDTCDKFIWKSGEVIRSKNKTNKQGITKTHINNISPSSPLGFGCSPHKDTYDILSEALVYSKFQAYFSKKLALY